MCVCGYVYVYELSKHIWKLNNEKIKYEGTRLNGIFLHMFRRISVVLKGVICASQKSRKS